jgi:hypothetical protein
MDGVSLTVGGVTAPILSVSNVGGTEQVNFQVPFEIAGRSTAEVVVTRSGTASAPQSVAVLAEQPGVYTAGGRGIAAHNANFSLVTDAAPLVAGEFAFLYAAGLGVVFLALFGMLQPRIEDFFHAVQFRAPNIAGVAELAVDLGKLAVDVGSELPEPQIHVRFQVVHVRAHVGQPGVVQQDSGQDCQHGRHGRQNKGELCFAHADLVAGCPAQGKGAFPTSVRGTSSARRY